MQVWKSEEKILCQALDTSRKEVLAAVSSHPGNSDDEIVHVAHLPSEGTMAIYVGTPLDESGPPIPDIAAKCNHNWNNVRPSH